MRIMLTADTVGGVWHYTTELAAGFATRGIETLIVAMGPPPSPAQRAEASAVNGCELRSTGLGLDWLAAGPDEVRRAAAELAEIAADWGADTVQLHSPAYAAAANWPAPLVAAAHSCVATWWQAMREGPLPVHLAWCAGLTADGLVTADAVIAPSHSFADMLTRTYALHREIRVIWNGRKQIPMQRTPHPHGFTAGRLWDEAKNITTLDAAASASRVLVRAAGAITGPNGAAVHPGHIRLLGQIGQAGLAREYARAAFFVSPARYEPFGLAVLEAAQAGCPLLLSDIPTFRELWDGVAHFVPPEDVDGLAAAMRRILDFPEAYERLAAAAQEHARRYTRAEMAAQAWAVHRDALASAPVPVG
jgi:glycosyltransferase involved in cell wall biosynthesis